MSVKVDYDHSLVTLRRYTSISSSLDEFLVGVSLLDNNPSTWTAITAATVSITNGYTPDDKGTLIVDAETASVALSFWDEPGEILYPSDRIQVRYGAKTLFYGVVDTTSLTYVTDPTAAAHGATRRVDFSATATGLYSVMMSRIVSWKKLSSDETHIQRIRHWVRVDGWS
jgi:hypothetical protein